MLELHLSVAERFQTFQPGRFLLNQPWIRAQKYIGSGKIRARLLCPVLAIQGEDDEFFSAAQLEALALLLPHLQVLRIPGAAHYPMHQARNEVLAAAIGFIQSAKGASTGTSSPRPTRRQSQ